MPTMAQPNSREWATLLPSPQIGQSQPFQVAKDFLNSEQVGQNLAGVFQVSQGIDHRNAGIVGKLFNLCLVVSTNGHYIQIAI